MGKTDQLAIVYDETSIDVGVLGGHDCGGTNSKIDAAREQGFRVMKTEYMITYEGKTQGEGPLVVGFTANIGADEVEEAIEADPQDSTQMVLNETTKRPVWPLEQIPAAATSNSDGFGAKGTFNPKWSVREGHGAVWWVYNQDVGALTTGTLIHIFAKHYGVWLSD